MTGELGDYAWAAVFLALAILAAGVILGFTTPRRSRPATGRASTWQVATMCAVLLLTVLGLLSAASNYDPLTVTLLAPALLLEWVALGGVLLHRRPADDGADLSAVRLPLRPLADQGPMRRRPRASTLPGPGDVGEDEWRALYDATHPPVIPSSFPGPAWGELTAEERLAGWIPAWDPQTQAIGYFPPADGRLYPRQEP